MRIFLTLVLSLIFLRPTAEASSAAWSTRLEAGEVILENPQQERWVFSKALEFRAARNELLLLTTQNKEIKSRWVENENLEVPTEIFERFLRLWQESSLQSRMESTLVSWSIEGDITHVVIKKALYEANIDASTVSSSELLWLGCYDGFTQCLGMNEIISNPNLLRNLILKEEVNKISREDLQAFLKRSAGLKMEDAEEAFLKARFPQGLAQWYALKLLSRKDSLEKPLMGNSYLAQISRYQSGDMIRNGVLLKAPSEFEVDFTIDRLDAQIREFFKARYTDIESVAKYVLAHLPMMSYEFDKGIGNWKVGPGFMFRVKRHIVKNPNSRSPLTMYKINDSVDLIITLNIGIHKDLGPAGASLGAGPGYMRKYLFSSYAPSREAAARSPWALTKEMLLGYSLETLKPMDSVTIESGWLASTSFSGNLNIFGSSKIRPQMNAFGAYRWLSRSYVHMDEKGDAYIGFGNADGVEVSMQAFLRVIARMAKVPFFNWSHSWMKQTGGVYKVARANFIPPMERAQLNRSISKGEEVSFKNKWPEVTYSARYSSSFSFLNLGFYKLTESQWNGFFELSPNDNDPIPMMQKRRRFLLLENTLDSTTKFSLTPQPSTQTCATWAAFEATTTDPAKFFDGSFKIDCTETYSEQKPLTGWKLRELSDTLKLKVENSHILGSKDNEDKELELHWDVQFSWKDLSALFAEKPTLWIEDLSQEIVKARTRTSSITHEEAQERLLIVTAMSQILGKKDEVGRATAFFKWVSTYPSKDLLLKALLKRLHHPAVRLQVFKPYATDSALIEQTYSYGTFEDTMTFKIIEEKNKWLGLN
ncbi:hypothetical protein [Bdellovibrio sp. HCB-110]|uniref:hypothetical protein n=1 Tax=Bdellovibrio sp. HCB-110 TaxID=3391182 RepID=UPI0039B494B5